MATGQHVAPSTRAREALPSPMRKLAPLAGRALADGVGIYHLNIGQPDIPIPRGILEGIQQFSSSVLPYAPSQGLAETVEAWRAYYAQLGVELAADQLLVTTGGSEAVLFALMAVADPGDEVLVFEPTYANYFGFARMASVGIRAVATRPEDGYHLPAAREIEAQITPHTRALLFTTVGNPTGTVYTHDELEMLGDIAIRHGLFLISDETYREIVFEGPGDTSMLKLEATAERTIVVDSLSKRFSVTGARIGCLASRHAGAMDGILRFAQARLAAPTVEQRAVIPLLRRPRTYTDQLVATYRRRRDVVYGALSEMPGVLVHRPEGAFYVFAVLPIDDCERFARWLLTDFRLDGETLMVAPGEGFYLTPGMGRREVRFAYVLEEDALRRAMALLREALRTYPGATR
ncbi:MAG: pyridoxal phosphate-dependent aminotransferase [Chloroflexi bacterium]|nr:pyridoxal phosphate-dependent aminotransferase [Chloroflexota bacterium]